VDAQYGRSTFQQQRNERRIGGREAVLTELGKYGLGERDLIANINFFSKVVVDDAGAMTLVPGHAGPGDLLDLRFEMDCIVVLHSGPHPLARGSGYAPAGVLLQAYRSAAVAANDPCRTRCPENGRGYLNTERHVAA
jgi:uncharacterized protein YcgI (DUF1989 family)